MKQKTTTICIPLTLSKRIKKHLSPTGVKIKYWTIAQLENALKSERAAMTLKD